MGYLLARIKAQSEVGDVVAMLSRRQARIGIGYWMKPPPEVGGGPLTAL